MVCLSEKVTVVRGACQTGVVAQHHLPYLKCRRARRKLLEETNTLVIKHIS